MKFAMSPPARDFLLGEREHSDLVVYVRLNGDLAEAVRAAALECDKSHPEIIRRAVDLWASQGSPKK